MKKEAKDWGTSTSFQPRWDTWGRLTEPLFSQARVPPEAFSTQQYSVRVFRELCTLLCSGGTGHAWGLQALASAGACPGTAVWVRQTSTFILGGRHHCGLLTVHGAIATT